MLPVARTLCKGRTPAERYREFQRVERTYLRSMLEYDAAGTPLPSAGFQLCGTIRWPLILLAPKFSTIEEIFSGTPSDVLCNLLLIDPDHLSRLRAQLDAVSVDDQTAEDVRQAHALDLDTREPE